MMMISKFVSVPKHHAKTAVVKYHTFLNSDENELSTLFCGQREKAHWIDWKDLRDGVGVTINGKSCPKIGVQLWLSSH
jgi:hypothetical protein